MHAQRRSLSSFFVVLSMTSVTFVSCSAPESEPETVSAAGSSVLERGGQGEFGPYEPVPNWPQPLADRADGVTHDGWTWGSTAAVYAETPDRIWIAQRGELPLPPLTGGGRGGPARPPEPWTPYGLLDPPRLGNGLPNGINAECQPARLRGWERRWHHTVFVVDSEGALVQEWPHLDKMFAQTSCNRGPHKIKMNPYDPEKHVWIIDDQQQVIWKFTYDGELVMTLGTLGQRGRDGGRLFNRLTDIAWLPDGTFFISDGYVGTRVAKFDRDGNFLMDWGTPPEDPNNPTPGRTSGTPCTASRSARTDVSLSWTAGTRASRCSMRTARSSTCFPLLSTRRRTTISFRPTSSSGWPMAGRTGSSSTISMGIS